MQRGANIIWDRCGSGIWLRGWRTARTVDQAADARVCRIINGSSGTHGGWKSVKWNGIAMERIIVVIRWDDDDRRFSLLMMTRARIIDDAHNVFVVITGITKLFQSSFHINLVTSGWLENNLKIFFIMSLTFIWFLIDNTFLFILGRILISLLLLLLFIYDNLQNSMTEWRKMKNELHGEYEFYSLHFFFIIISFFCS